MPAEASSSDYAPLFWYKRNPFYLTAFICAALLAGILLTPILEYANLDAFNLLGFTPAFFLHGAFWQVATYPFVDEPNFFSLFNVMFFFFAGNEVEKYLGRKRYLTLLLMLLLSGPAIMCAWRDPSIQPTIFGPSFFAAAMIIGFATLHPDLEYWGWIPLKWIAAGCLFLSSLSFLPRHNWKGLVILWGMCAITFGYIRWLQKGAELPRWLEKFLAKFRRKPKFRVVPRENAPREELHESIDPILDKISKSGLASLSAKEKQILERTSNTLKKKD